MSANKPYVIGLTGGIATGKSTASRHLTEIGAYCVDADQLSHELMEAGGGAVEAVRQAFGDEYILPDGSVDRKKLGMLIFADVQQRRRLEGIIHPIVQRTTLQRIREAQAQGIPVVILDVPLLFESGMDVLCNETWVVTLTPRKQLQRLMFRDHLSEADAVSRIESQMPQEEKVSRATLEIENEKTEEHLKAELTKLYNAVLRRAERENA